MSRSARHVAGWCRDWLSQLRVGPRRRREGAKVVTRVLGAVVVALGLWLGLVTLAAAALPHSGVQPADASLAGGGAGASEARPASVSVELTIWRPEDRRALIKAAGSKGAEEQKAIRQSVPAYGARVDGVATYGFDAADRARTVTLLDFAAFMSREPQELDALAYSAFQGGPWGPSGLRVLEAVDDRGRTIAVRRGGEADRLEFVLPAGSARVTLRYRVQVPRRYWPFGCVRSRCSISGAIAPLPSVPAEGGRYLEEGGRVVAPARWQVRKVRFGAAPHWVPGTDPTAIEAKALDGDEIVIAREGPFAKDLMAYPSVFWGPRWRRLVMVTRGVQVHVLHMDPRPHARYPNESVLQYRADVAGHVEAIAKETIDIAARLGVEAPPDAQLVVVQGPLRSDLAQSHPTAVMVSDEYLNVLPSDRFRRFHEVQVARAMLDTLTLGFLAEHQPPSTQLWLSGAMSFALAQVWQAKRDLPDEDARDLLRNVSFMPAVDSFLYRGQASFASAYFRGGEDQFVLRNHPLWFAHTLPTGRRIHEKLDDLLDDAQLARWHALNVQYPGADPERNAESVWGYELDWFFDQWLGEYPEVDYAVGKLVRKKLSQGHWRTTIEIWKSSAAPVLEPVQVEAIESDGTRHNLIWNGEAVPGKALDEQPLKWVHTFEIDTSHRIEYVRVDPRFRITETSRIPTFPGGRPDNNDPRFNNRRPGNRRFIYTGVGIAIAASEFLNAETPGARVNSIAGFFAFEAGLRRDLRTTGTFSVFKDREVLVGAGAAANFFFLEKVNRQRRRLRLRASLTGAWLGTNGLDPRGGVRTEETLLLSDDTRQFGFWPDRGHRISGGIRFSQVRRLEAGQTDDRDSASVFAEWVQLWPIAHDHVIASRLAGEVVLPINSDLEYRALPRVGGLGGLSAFVADEAFGRSVLTAQVEYRHVFLNDLRVNAANLAWWRSFGGALFGGVSTFSGCADYNGMFTRGQWRGQVGYGLTAYVHYLGLAPQLLRLEAAVPIGRARTACLGQIFPDALAEAQGLPGKEAQRLLPPVTFNLLFNQPF